MAYSKRYLHRYNIERRLNKSDCGEKQLNGVIKNELHYWKYPCRQIGRAVSEPNLQKVHVMGTKILQKSNSFHELHNNSQQRNKRNSVDSFEPKLLTWKYVSEAQCYDINFAVSDKNLLTFFCTSTPF